MGRSQSIAAFSRGLPVPGRDMLGVGVFLLMMGTAQAPAITAQAPAVTAQAAADTTLPRLVAAPNDTPPPRTRPRIIEVSDWYSRRLTIHRYVSYATIPVFALQWAAGDQLYHKSSAAPTWAKTTHRAGATALAGMFTVNTVTGVWNWWDSRQAPQGRVLRTIHALSMLTADAAFTYAGVKLADEAETSSRQRDRHHTLALEAMGLSVVSGVAMKIFNR